MALVGVLIENDYEDLEYWYPKLRLLEEGHEVFTLAKASGQLFKSKHGYEAKSDKSFGT